MTKVVNLRAIKDQDACANCSYLRWGSEEDWDVCGLDGHLVEWAKKCNMICDDHVRSKAEVPRIAANTKKCRGCGAPLAIAQEQIRGPDNEVYNEYKCGSKLYTSTDEFIQEWACKKIQELKGTT